MSLGKVYIAAPWVEKERAKNVGYEFERAGFTVVSKWLHYDAQYNPDELREQALGDYKDLRDADMLVLLNYRASEGKATELGIALERGLPIISVFKNDHMSIFNHLPEVVRVRDVAEAIDTARRV